MFNITKLIIHFLLLFMCSLIRILIVFPLHTLLKLVISMVCLAYVTFILYNLYKCTTVVPVKHSVVVHPPQF